MSVPSSVLVTFFQEATKALDECSLENVPSTSASSSQQQQTSSLPDLRRHLLAIQVKALQHVVKNFDDVTEDQVKMALRDVNKSKDSSVLEGNSEMNEAARFAISRLVLNQECHLFYRPSETEQRPGGALKASGSIDRTALMEFCALCTNAVKLQIVRDHLSSGSPLFGIAADTAELAQPTDMAKRLERIQQFMMMAVGYEAEFGTSEIKRIFVTAGTTNEFSNDTEVASVFGKLLETTHEAMIKISIQQSVTKLSDQSEGGVTRVVSVNYSEKIVDPETGRTTDDNAAPQAMVQEETQRKQLEMARQAAVLQQSILGELMSMSEEERKAAIADARETAAGVTREMMQLPQGAERVQFMQSVPQEKQRKMIMYSLWTNMKKAHGGKEPVFHNHS